MDCFFEPELFVLLVELLVVAVPLFEDEPELVEELLLLEDPLLELLFVLDFVSLVPLLVELRFEVLPASAVSLSFEEDEVFSSFAVSRSS